MAATCAIIGAGLGGVALLASMALRGYRVRLHDVNDARLAAIRARGGIDVEGLFEGFARAELSARAHSLSLGEGEGRGEGSVAFTNHPG